MRVILGVLLLLVASTLPALGGGLEELARQRIAQETGLDEDLIATMFISEEDAQFILTFIYIEERTFNSRLKPELLEAIAPYRDRAAMLVLVTPSRESYFNPLSISFAQEGVTYRVRPDAIRRISDNFTGGTIPAGEVSAGVILLDRLEPELTLLGEGPELDVNRPFQIGYRGYTADFALRSGGSAGLGADRSGDNVNLLEFLLLQLLSLLLFLLLSFLI